MSTDYEKRLKLPVSGNPDTEFYSSSGTFIAKGYMRICIGGRGPYVEFRRDHILALMEDSKVSHYYFKELRTLPDRLFVYYQLRTVDYADYRIGFYYISPFSLFSPVGVPVIDPLHQNEYKQLELFRS